MKANSRLRRWIVVVGAALLLCWFPCGAQEPATLSAVARTGNQFQFILAGRPGARYVIEFSTNLVTWIPLATNHGAGAIRTIRVNAPDQTAFYRAADVGRPYFQFAVTALDRIYSQAANFSADSFDSTDPQASTDGRYDPAKARDRADVVCLSGWPDSLDLSNAQIAGTVQTVPGGTMRLGPQGAVGSKAWLAANTGIEPGHFMSNLDWSLPPMSVPFVAGFTPAGGWITNLYTQLTIVSNSTAATIAYPQDPPSPPAGFVTTNSATSTTYPEGSPGPITTTIVTNTILATTRTFPAPGTYVGVVTSNNVVAGDPMDRGWFYTYNYITGFTTNYTYPTFIITYVIPTTNTNAVPVWYDYVLHEGDYSMASLSGSVYVGGQARLYVEKSFNLTRLTIETNQSLDLYCAASSARFMGEVNGPAPSFRFWGLPACLTVSFGSAGSFRGAIYAPNAEVAFGVGGLEGLAYSGALVAWAIRFDAKVNFHFDESLLMTGPAY